MSKVPWYKVSYRLVAPMNAFPFSQSEWQRVQDASLPVVNATLADDDVLRRSRLVELVSVLDDLRARYGDHPVLDETEADFLDDPSGQLTLYRRAIELAERHLLPTLAIRISLAGLLIHDFQDRQAAARELAACEPEAALSADDYEQRDWRDLLAECQRPAAG